MTNEELITEIDNMGTMQVIQLVNAVPDTEAETLPGGDGIPPETVFPVISAYGLKSLVDRDAIGNGLGTNIIRPTHNSGNNPNG